MRTIPVYRDAYDRVVKCYQKHIEFRRRSPEFDAIFSGNPDKQVWPVDTYGPSDPDDRKSDQCKYKFLNELVEIVLAHRDLGGRFFINKSGLFVKPEGFDMYQLVSFHLQKGWYG